MPCYDSRNDERQVLVTDEHRARLFKEWTHNSPVAELLCYTLTNLPKPARDNILQGNMQLRRWWVAHKERDAAKAKKRKV